MDNDEKQSLENALGNGTFHNPALDEEFNAGNVAWVLLNPIYTGIDPYPPLLPEDKWIKAFSIQVEKVGLELCLKGMLTALRQTYKIEDSEPPLNAR